MKLEIYINDKLWKSTQVGDENYQPSHYWPEISKQRDSGLLDSFGVNEGMKVEFRKVIED